MEKFTTFFSNLVATFFFVGRIPKMPGTFGSLAALPFAWYLWQLPPAWAWAITALVFALGVWASRHVIRRSGKPDDQTIVIDEVVGIFLTTSLASGLWWHYLLAFLLFRIFDIWKPWPVQWVDTNWKNALGTMMDDVVAALMAAATFYVTLSFSSRFFAFA